MKKNWKKISQCRKKLKGGPFGIFNIHSVGKYQNIEGGLLVRIFVFEKESHRDENTLKEYPLALLSFLDDIKILLRKLSKNCKDCKNCKKSGPFRVRL